MNDSKLRLPKPKLTNHPVDIGLRTEAAILSELTRRGYAVLAPWGVNRMLLRVAPPLNGQARRIRWAQDYELPG